MLSRLSRWRRQEAGGENADGEGNEDGDKAVEDVSSSEEDDEEDDEDDVREQGRRKRGENRSHGVPQDSHDLEEGNLRDSKSQNGKKEKKNRRQSLKKASTTIKKDDEGGIETIRELSFIKLPEAKPVFERQHYIISIILGVVVATWIFGIEGLCLFAESCMFYTHRQRYNQDHFKLNLVDTTNPHVPANGAMALFLAAIFVIFVLTPGSLYLTRTETRRNVRLASLVSILGTVLLILLGIIFFSKSPKVQYDYNSSAQRLYSSAEEANKAARKSSSMFGFLFFAAASLQATLAAYIFKFSRDVPFESTRPSRIQIIARPSRKEDPDIEIGEAKRRRRRGSLNSIQSGKDNRSIEKKQRRRQSHLQKHREAGPADDHEHAGDDKDDDDDLL